MPQQYYLLDTLVKYVRHYDTNGTEYSAEERNIGETERDSMKFVAAIGFGVI